MPARELLASHMIARGGSRGELGARSRWYGVVEPYRWLALGGALEGTEGEAAEQRIAAAV